MKMSEFAAHSFDYYPLSQTIHSRFKQHFTHWLGAVLLMFAGTAYSDHTLDHEVANLKGGLGAIEQRLWDCENGVGNCLGTPGPTGPEGPEGPEGQAGSTVIPGFYDVNDAFIGPLFSSAGFFTNAVWPSFVLMEVPERSSPVVLRLAPFSQVSPGASQFRGVGVTILNYTTPDCSGPVYSGAPRGMPALTTNADNFFEWGLQRSITNIVDEFWVVPALQSNQLSNGAALRDIRSIKNSLGACINEFLPDRLTVEIVGPVTPIGVEPITYKLR